MFKKTRNRIMLLNMLTASAVVIVAFAVIFVTAYTRERAQNREKLFNNIIPHISITGSPFIADTIHVTPLPDGFDAASEFGHSDGFDMTSSMSIIGGYSVVGFPRRIIPDAGLSFSILVDSEGGLVYVNSMVDLPDSLYEQAALEATGHHRRNQVIVLDGRTWQYDVSQVSVEFQESSNLSFIVSGAYDNIRFLDVTDSHRMIRNLGLTLVGLTIIILAAFFFISRVFANRAIRPMEEAFEIQSRFVADASHELKTPLAVISADCGVMYANREESMESQMRWVDSIARATDRMTGLVGDLLSLARMEDRELSLHMANMDLSAAVDEAVADMEQSAYDKGLALRKQIEPGIEIVNDRDQTQRILAILLENAIKYTDSGGEISVTLKQEKRRAVCAVRNSGDGVPQEELPHLFDRFYRGDPARASENPGFGLGLAIAGTIAQRMDAKLTASSEPGKYTEFRLTL